MIHNFYKAAKDCVGRKCTTAIVYEMDSIPSIITFAASTLALTAYFAPKTENLSNLVLKSGLFDNGHSLNITVAALGTLTCMGAALTVVSPMARAATEIVGSVRRAKKTGTPVFQHLSDVTKAVWSVRKEIGSHHNLAETIRKLSHYKIPSKLEIDNRDESMDGLYFLRKCSPLFSEAVTKAWREIPVLYKELSYILGGSAYAGRTMGDIYPDQKYTQARFACGTATYNDHTFGFYNPRSKQICLSEYKLSEAYVPTEHPLPDEMTVTKNVWSGESPKTYGQVLHHEFGHFISGIAKGYIERISDTESFVAAYQKDKKINNMSCLIADKEEADREELFAELWAEVRGGSLSSETIIYKTPNTLSWMKQFNKDLLAALNADGVVGLRARRIPHTELFISKIRQYSPKPVKDHSKSAISYKLTM